MAKGRRSGMRRAYLKKFSAAMINTGQGVDTSKMNDNDLFRYHDRLRSIHDPIPTTITIGAPNSPRTAVLSRLSEQKRLIQSDFFQKIQTFNFIMLRSGKVNRLKMFFSGNEAFFIEENLLTGVAKRSVIYKGREKAMNRYRQERITWVETCRIPETQTGESSGDNARQ